VDLNGAYNMAEGLKLPPQFTLGPDAAKERPQWREHFEFYMKATKKSAEDGTTKVAILVTAIRKDAISINETMTCADNDDANYLNKVLDALI
jgi:hypothetical protein